MPSIVPGIILLVAQTKVSLNLHFFHLILTIAPCYLYSLSPLHPIAYTLEIMSIKSLITSLHLHYYILVHSLSE